MLRGLKESHAGDYGISRMGIFCSAARGEQAEASDVDICIESPSMGLPSLSGIDLKLEKLLEAPVDVVRMHKSMNPRLRQRIKNEVAYV